MKKKLVEYIPEMALALTEHIKSDQIRWGDTWMTRSKDGQEERVFARYTDYFDQFRNAGTPIPWLKVIGEALICWVRENRE